ncbi:FCD domain protein [Aeromicrobium marinum DSM 15272]|uniref:FCD domain protein n=1 Tax=Aeromicrobium marinum DSM 15272 TaxID=585531 RepID=E2SG99_9ACTN|nr:GntR family transcriptional regulator [Aeromicrobium marinum]EFQ81856.1 FCD domain protein [Aeromicrobium marinum DSM 15272]
MSDERTTATDRVFLALREAVVSGELVAGSQHSIYRLAEDLGVSRTPVRDAVLRLADLGLVAIERNRGVRIRGVTVEDVRAVFELRVLLESPAAAFAARHADRAAIDDLDRLVGRLREAAHTPDEPEFTGVDRALHARIGAVLNNPRWQDQVHRLRDTIQARGVSTIGRTRRMPEIAEEHVPIVEAIRSRDPHEAARRMSEHLIGTAELLVQQVAGEPAGSSDSRWGDRVRALLAVTGPGDR